MVFITDDTICAIASAPGGAARGIVRISGPAALIVAGALLEPVNGLKFDTIRRATALPCRIRLGIAGHIRVVSCDLFLWPGDRSYTREPVAELHTVGSQPILEAVVNAVCRAGARPAEPGEFTLRAFLAGRLDLTQAEAVLGVIDAQAETDLSAALGQLAGGLTRPLHQLREDLLQLLAELEAGLDFVEEDIEFVSSAEVVNRLRSAGDLLERVEHQLSARHTTSYAPQIALVGPPNAGKSSLFNALVQRFGTGNRYSDDSSYSALVSPVRGTTRDYLMSRIAVNGFECELVDTAGFDIAIEKNVPSLSTIGRIAEALSLDRKTVATVVLYCLECTEIAKSYVREIDVSGEFDLLVLTKSDLQSCPSVEHVANLKRPVVLTSSRTNAGLEELRAALGCLLAQNGKQDRSSVVATTADRCRESVRSARQSIKSAADVVTSNAGNELVATELRDALTELGKVVGAVYTDDLLDRIFSKFCIGK